LQGKAEVGRYEPPREESHRHSGQGKKYPPHDQWVVVHGRGESPESDVGGEDESNEDERRPTDKGVVVSNDKSVHGTTLYASPPERIKSILVSER